MKPDQNTVLSPYSIQCAMAMAYEGADGTTRTAMAKVLHYPNNDEMRNSLRNLRESLRSVSTNSQRFSETQKKEWGRSNDPFMLTTANRLFGQSGFEFRPEYLSLLKDSYAAPFEALDFRKNPIGAAQHINSWVEKETQDRIRDLVSADALNDFTRLVLVNAIYLKVPWLDPFEASVTKRQPFHASKRPTIQVPTMSQKGEFGYRAFNKMTVLVLPYEPSDLQFLILLPDSRNGIDALQQTLSADLLQHCANLNKKEIVLYLPKFKLEPPLFDLKNNFEARGMKQTFNVPIGSANFDHIAPRRADDYLYISDVFHKTFVDVDEKGTEAAAATAIAAVATLGMPDETSKPLEVHVDHPFLFAIQHRETGACLFLGRVNDPSKN